MLNFLANLVQRILNYAPTQVLASEEKDLVWKFRYYLTRDKRSLTKFLKSVTWRDSNEVKQAVEILLPLWSDIDTDDALELLGPNTVDSRVRRFAVKQLNRAGPDVRTIMLSTSGQLNFLLGTHAISVATGASSQI
jgi:phosphatidylinositol 3-kinase